MTNTLWSSARSTGWTLLQSILSHASLADRHEWWRVGEGVYTKLLLKWHTDFCGDKGPVLNSFRCFSKRRDFFKSVNVCCYVVFERGLELCYIPDVVMC